MESALRVSISLHAAHFEVGQKGGKGKKGEKSGENRGRYSCLSTIEIDSRRVKNYGACWKNRSNSIWSRPYIFPCPFLVTHFPEWGNQ